MNQLNFFIEGIPIAKARARVWHKHRQVGNFNLISTGAYTPERTRTWEEYVKSVLNAEIKKRFFDWQPWENCGVELRLYFTFPMPKTLQKTRRFQEVGINAFNHIFKPDLDNLVKAIKDSFQGILYKDDSQVCQEIVMKKYHANKFGVEVEAKRL